MMKVKKRFSSGLWVERWVQYYTTVLKFLCWLYKEVFENDSGASFERNPSVRKEELFGALDILRGHLLRCIEEIAKIGKVTPRLTNQLEFDKKRPREIYERG